MAGNLNRVTIITVKGHQVRKHDWSTSPILDLKRIDCCIIHKRGLHVRMGQGMKNTYIRIGFKGALKADNVTKCIKGS